MTTPAPTPAADLDAWNRAHDRLVQFLNTFALGDRAYVSRLALEILEQAREIHRAHPSEDPTAVTLSHAQKKILEWLAKNMDEEAEAPSRILATGYIALLLSRLYRSAPQSFLSSPLPEELRESLQRTLIVAGPDLKVSSMTPRHLDYGPMLDLARQTWHRWDGRAFAVALVFWAGVYTIFYWWLSQAL
jgi:hypothetical protein